jgi:hypothetical protein
MMFKEGKRLPSGLDDGIRPTKKEQKAKNAARAAKEAGEAAPTPAPARGKDGQEKPEMPTIRPGERLSEFAARVDQALPISGLINKTAKNGKDPLGLKVGRTKTEKRMHRMYAEWREQEVKIQAARQEALELAEEEELDDEGRVKWSAIDEEAGTASKKKKGKKGKKKMVGEVDDGDDDPWKALVKKRNEEKLKVSDVYDAPPVFNVKPKEKFKVRGARVDVEDVPKAAGSLRRREELGEVRSSVIESYRKMMAENRAAAQAEKK